MSLTQIRKVRQYYDSTAADYEEFWSGERDLAMHFGYYDKSVETHEQSLLKMNQVFARLAGTTSSDRVLDAGCGCGGTSIWLATNVGCRVEGINIIPYQLRIARRFAAKFNVSGKVRFSQQDYCSTSFRSGSFDSVLALESVVHAENKIAFASESVRLLKAGGRLIMSDLMVGTKGPYRKGDQKRLQRVESGWAITNLMTPQQCKKLFSDAGFTDVQLLDWTKYVRQSVKMLANLCRVALPEAKKKVAAGFWNVPRFENVLACIYIDELLDAGVLRYFVMISRKP
jgi:cyclopropane fatty-acyl-phospholipid synthase-like methyltransferase